MFKFGCSLCNKTWQIGEARTCTCKYAEDDYKKPWVGLTDEEIISMSRYDLEYAALIGEVQRKLKEKNT